MFYTRVFNAGTHKLVGHLVDITPEGAMLISETPVATGQVLHLQMELSPEVAEQPYLEFDARSLWCRPDVNPQFFNTGFELLGLAPEAVRIVERIVEAYGFRDN